MGKGKLTQNKVHLEEHEYKTVKFLLEQGYDIELIPPSQIKNLRMPDIMLQGAAWEMKSPVGSGKYTIKNIIQSASHQAENIVVDLRRSKMDEKQAIQEIRRYFDFSKRIRKIIIITKSEEMIDFSK